MQALDAYRCRPYLHKAMLRRLITLLAILSGLTAVNAPAQASVSGALGAALELTQRAEQPGKGETAPCAQRQRDLRAKGDKTAPCKPAPTVSVVIPTIMFGPDRALE